MKKNLQKKSLFSEWSLENFEENFEGTIFLRKYMEKNFKDFLGKFLKTFLAKFYGRFPKATAGRTSEKIPVELLTGTTARWCSISAKTNTNTRGTLVRVTVI